MRAGGPWQRLTSAPPPPLLAAAILSELIGTLCLKGGLEHRWLYAVTVVGYVSSFVFLTLVLKAGMMLGVAYGIWSACGVVLTVGLSAVIFSEPVTPTMAVGVAVVIVGVLAVELGSGHATTVTAPDDGAAGRRESS